MESVKLNIIQFLLNINIKIGKRLAFYQAKYSASKEIEEVVKKQNFDLRGMTNRLKNIIIYDQDIIDKRWSECEKCEFLIKPTNNCSQCGCFMKAKIRVATASCPIGKWKKEYNFIEGRAVNGINTTT